MERETIAATVFAIAATAVLATGAWMWFASGEETEAEPTDGPPRKAAPSPIESTSFEVPRCPISVTLDGTFEKLDVEAKQPNIRLLSRPKEVQVEISCREASGDFDRQQFLDETLRAVKGRFEGEILGERKIDADEAVGYSTWAEANNELRMFNVLVRQRTIAVINVAGALSEETRRFNHRFVEEQISWKSNDH